MKLKIKNELRAPITKGMMGLFFEDINYALDGGLYAEMIENHSFEFLEARGVKEHYVTELDGMYGWSAYPDTANSSSMKIQSINPLNQVNPHYLEFTASNTQMAFTNKAYDGICIKKDLNYRISLYARTENYRGQLSVLIEKEGRLIASAVIAEAVNDEWVNYQTDIVSKEDISSAAFVIKLSSPGTVYFDFISMMPSDAVLGIFRKDLAELLKELRPGFLRFPGGCVVEGNTMDNRYQWKKSVGKPEERKANWNRWAVHDNSEEKDISQFSHYNQSLGIGYYEYFLLCEYLGAKPLPVINVGLACQYQSIEFVPTDDPTFQEYVEDALDLIEFANGPVDSKWGSLRSQMGHPSPFGLDLIGIGNEQWETEQIDFFKRYEIFEREIHREYPGIKLIGSAGPDVSSSKHTEAWSYYRGVDKKDFVYAVDEHYYVDPDWFCNNVHFYDKYPRDIKVFAGEYAAHTRHGMNPSLRNTWKAALSEAAFLTGIERNADVVVLASYAPLFARLGYTQWSPDMIWFDAKRCYGSPSYYVQKMYCTQTGTDLLEVNHDVEEIPYSVSYDRHENAILVKLANITEHTVHIRMEMDFKLKEYGELYYIQGQEDAVNSIEEPEKVVIREQMVKTTNNMEYEIGAKAFHVIKMYCEDDSIVVIGSI